jgi:hypothetical protein
LYCDVLHPQDGNDSGVINVPAASNTLNLLMRDAGLMRFVKYISAAAPGSRWACDGVGLTLKTASLNFVEWAQQNAHLVRFVKYMRSSTRQQVDM